MTTPPVPAQRKVKLLTALKSTQSEQASKLQSKQQLETDLLEDIRSYAKLRATAEKDYAQALQKITSQMLNKFQSKDDLKEEDSRTPYGLWRKILEDTEIMANARLKVSQTLTTDIAESIKTLKTDRGVIIKKCTALNDKLHEELLVSANEMIKTQKNYTDLEKITLQAKDAATDAQTKLQKGNVGIFSSKSKLEKALSKANERRDVSETRSTAGRNDYLLYIAAMNAHQRKYYALDLPDLIAVQDGNIYENFKEYYNIITNTEKELLQQGITNIEGLQQSINDLQRAYAIQFFLKENPVFTKCTPLEMIPVPGDEVSTISQEFEAGLSLNKEARKWCLRLAQKQKMIRKRTKELTKLMESTDANLNAPEPATTEKDKDGKAGPVKTKEERIEAMNEDIRHMEVMRTKAEGRVEALKLAGINTDEWLQGALQEQDEEEEREEKENENLEKDDYGEEDDFDEWDEPSSSFSPPNYSDDALSTTSSDVTRLGTPAVAIYTFDATSQEELSVFDGEELDFLETQGDGWCKTRNKTGQVGYVPESYIEIKPKIAGLNSDQASPASSLTGSMASDAYQIEPIPETPSPSTALSTTVPEFEVTEVKMDYLCFAKAIYDYDAMEEEELSFKEGDVIMVTSQEVDEDDGWWEGVLDGKHGVFPSIVVEETKPPDPGAVSVDYPLLRTRAQTDQFSTYPRSRSNQGRPYSMVNER